MPSPRGTVVNLMGRNRHPRLAHFVGAAFRFAIVVFALLAAGCLHAALDIARACAVVAHHDGDPEDDGGRSCPPACPQCHCANPMIAPLPARPRPVLATLLPEAELPQAPPWRAIQTPDLDAIYRPPRAAA